VGLAILQWRTNVGAVGSSALCLAEFRASTILLGRRTNAEIPMFQEQRTHWKRRVTLICSDRGH
ncbi:MAG: hypothetical protein WB463_14100, partial [Pseudolabrys sp.]